jgi:hypothetical protein
MTLVTYNAETGTQGTTLTTANSGANTVAIGTGCTATFDSQAAAHGNLGYWFVTASGQQNLARFMASAANLQMAFEGSFIVPATPSASRQIMTLRSATGPAFKLVWTTSNFLQIQDAAGSNSVTTNNTLVPGTVYRVAVLLTVATSTTGHFSVNIYEGDSTTPRNGTPYTSTTYNLGTGAIVGGDFGGVGALTGTLTVGWDDIRFNDGATSEIGPVVTTKQGSGAGTVAFTAAASGTATRTGSGAGTVAFTGSAAGVRTPRGTASGTVHYTGTATGSRPVQGHGAGTVTFTATAAGQATHKGSATASVVFTGTGNGVAPTVGAKYGTATGTVRYTGAGTGSTTRHGTTTGTLTFTGTATGTTTRAGSAVGTLTLTALAHGGNTAARDLTLTAAPLPTRWAATPVLDRWGVTPNPARWATAPLET